MRIFATSSWSQETLALAYAFGYIAMPQIFFYGMYTILGQVLNAHGRFAAYMWAPALANVVAIGGLIAFRVLDFPLQAEVSEWDSAMIWLLAGSATASIMVQAFVLLIPLRRMGFRYRPTFGFRGVGLGSASVVAFWTFLAIVLSQARFAVVSQVLTEAMRRYEPATSVWPAPDAPCGHRLPAVHAAALLITVSLATAIFTRVSHAVQDGDVEAIKADLRRGLRMPAVFSCRSRSGRSSSSRSSCARSSSTPPENAAMVSKVTIALLIGSLPMSLAVHPDPFFYAHEDAKTRSTCRSSSPSPPRPSPSPP